MQRIRGRWTGSLLVAFATIAMLAAPIATQSAVAQDTSSIQTRVMVLHGATDLGQIEISFNGEEALDEFDYGELSEWITLDPGTVQVWVTRDRAGINYTVFNAVYPVPAGNDYYLVISDALVIGGVFDRNPLMGDNSRSQVTHASVDTPAINVVTTGDEVTLATQLAYARTSDAVEVPAGTYSAEVRLADTGETLLTVPDGTVEAGMVYQHILIGAPGDEEKPLQLVTLSTTVQERDAEGSPTP
jgi:hypothetical protein